jgi:hypothetical protein
MSSSSPTQTVAMTVGGVVEVAVGLHALGPAGSLSNGETTDALRCFGRVTRFGGEQRRGATALIVGSPRPF